MSVNSFTPADVRAAALQLLADMGTGVIAKATATFDEAKHKRDHGRFSSTGGASAATDAPASSKPPSWLKRNTLERLPPKARKVAAVIGKTYFLTFVMANKAVKAVAQNRGLDEAKATKLASVLTGVDMALGGSRSSAAMIALGLPALAVPAAFVPLASVGYLAYSTARHPSAVAAAARDAIAKVAGKVAARVLKSAGAAGAPDYDFADAVAEALEAHGWDDFYHALLVEGVRVAGNVAHGIALANDAWDQTHAGTVAKSLFAALASRYPVAKSACAGMSSLVGSDGGFLVPTNTVRKPARKRKKRKAVSAATVDAVTGYAERVLKALAGSSAQVSDDA